jgi:hypothetical protein
MPPHLGRCALLLVGLGAGACINLSTFHTGRTLPKGQLRLGGGIGVATVKEFALVTGVEGLSGDGLNIPLPNAEINARYGLTDEVELGVKLYTVGVGAEVRTQLVGDKKSPFAMSFGASANYFGISIPESVDGEALAFDAGFGMLDMSTSFNLSYTLPGRLRWLTAYAAPKYISRTIAIGGQANDVDVGAGIGIDLLGGSYGVAIGRNFTLYLEGGSYATIGFQGVVSQFGVGFDF